jgi:hypothetical protein
MTANLGSGAYANCGNINVGLLAPTLPHQTLCIGFNDGSVQAMNARQGLMLNGKRIHKDIIYNPD